MRVTRLEIFGFKSFVERFTLNFDRSMIGIVGPNGCGKSNIVDALRWVLGETYAKQLRGTVLDDLIFNGSDSRRPLGMAEVSVTIRPDEGWTNAVMSNERAAIEAAAGGGHTQIMNGVHEKAENDEFLSVSRLLEQAEAGAVEVVTGDTNPAVTAEGPATDTALAVTPDAADGEGSAVAEVMPPFLREVPGLLGSAEIQFTRRLYRSGESEYFINKIPCRLRDMTDIYRLIGLGARGLSIVQQGEIGDLISKKPVERRELLEEAAGIAGFRTRMEAATRKLEQTSENMNRLRDIIIEVEKQVKILQRQAKRARERNDLKANIRAVELELYSARLTKLLGQHDEYLGLRDRLANDVDVTKGALSVAEAELEKLQSELEGFDVELSDKRRDLDGLQTVLQAAREQQRQLEVECARMESRAKAVQQNLSRLEERGGRLAQEREERTRKVETLSEQIIIAEERRAEAERVLTEVQEREMGRLAELATHSSEGEQAAVDEQLRKEIEQLTVEVEQIPALNEQVRSLEQQVRESRREGDQARDKLGKQRVRIAAVEGEIRSLESQLNAMAEHVVRRTAGESEKELEALTADGVVKSVLVAGLQVPEELQRVFAAALGERGTYLVSGNPSLLGSRYQALRGPESGKDKGAAKIGVIDERGLSGAAREEADAHSQSFGLDDEERTAAPSAVRLLDLVRVNAGFEAAAGALLGQYYLVDNFAEAIALNELNRNRGRALRWIVSKTGEVSTPWGWYTTEGKGGSFSFTRRIEEQRQVHAELQQAQQGYEEELARFEDAVKTLQQQLAQVQQERDRLYAAQRQLGSLVQRERQLERERREAQAREERRRRDEVMAEERNRQADLRRLISERAQIQSALDFEKRKLEDLARDEAAGAEQSAEMRQELGVLEQSQRELIEQLSSCVEGQRDSLERVQADCERLSVEIQGVDMRRSMLRTQIHHASHEVTRVRRELESMQEQHMKAAMQLEKCELERGMIFEERTRSYPDLAEVTVFRKEEAEELLARVTEIFGNAGSLDEHIAKSQEEAGKLRRRLEREGEVDPQAIELFEQEDARLAEMQTQLADLEGAKEILERTIRQLKDVSRKRFMDTYEKVSTKFSELIPRLFGGGAGHLELLNPEDPLTSGVQLIVRPPGKKVSNMELLSGGEKALVSTAVLVAMFLHRPSPICVLDEVDAPLDDANLERFLGLVAEISKSTQFLVITHNKQTMAAVDRLIGITMQEKGVTTALSVTLEEAERHIESTVAAAA